MTTMRYPIQSGILHLNLFENIRHWPRPPFRETIDGKTWDDPLDFFACKFCFNVPLVGRTPLLPFISDHPYCEEDQPIIVQLIKVWQLFVWDAFCSSCSSGFWFLYDIDPSNYPSSPLLSYACFDMIFCYSRLSYWQMLSTVGNRVYK